MLKINNKQIDSVYIGLADGSSKSVSKIYSTNDLIYEMTPYWFTGTATGDITWYYNGDNSTSNAITATIDSDGNFLVLKSDYNTINVTSMQNMFIWQTKITSLDLSNIDTSKVTDMSRLFYGCYNLTSLNINHWDMSNIDTTIKSGATIETRASSEVSAYYIKGGCEIFGNCGNLSVITCSSTTKAWLEKWKDYIGLSSYWNNITWTIVS